MARNDPQVNFRIPAELKQRLETAAEKNNRSFKAEIEYRLDNWEEAVEQIDLAQEGWEAARLSAEFHKRHADALTVEMGIANSRYENLEDRYREYREEVALEVSKSKSEAIPHSLLQRIERRASETGRTPQEEISLALEAAFPPPPIAGAFSSLGLELLVVQWFAGNWHAVDWMSWEQFRSGRNPGLIAEKQVDGRVHLILLVFGEGGDLANIIPHNYVVTDTGCVAAPFELLNDAEKADYNRLMTASLFSAKDEAKLQELQTKMEPGLALPEGAIPRLREALKDMAPSEVIDRLLLARGHV